MLDALSGTLLSGRFLERRLADVLPTDNERARRFARRLRPWWRRTRLAFGPAMSVRSLIDDAVRPFFELLDAGVGRAMRLADDLWQSAVATPGVSLPLLITSWGRPLDAAWRDAARAGLARRARWCLLFSGTHVRVYDAGAATARRFLEIDLAAASDDEGSARMAWVLLARACLEADATGAPQLGRLVVLSDEEGVAVRAGLRHGVREGLARLTGGMLAAAARGRRVEPVQDAYGEALTAIFRLLFLFFAEARGLVPAWHDVYRASYTVDALRTIADDPTADPAGMWEAFQAISRMAHAGCEAGDLRVTAFNGRLFAPDRSPRLDRVAVQDDIVRDAVRALSSVATPNGRERVSYGDLGVEQLGGVYETLLEYAPVRQPGGADVALVRTGPERRKTSGTFYTPEAITRYLVRQALEPLTADAGPSDVLALRVVDPAMGSGAFLVAACTQLAAAYEAALVRDGQCQPSDLSERDRAEFRRLVAQRCLFGVDVNPMAVHLARLSLWLTTLAGDRPLGFLDHHLLVGDSLLGTTLAQVALRPPGSVRSVDGGDTTQLPLFDHSGLQGAVRSTLPIRQRIELQPDETAGDVRQKEAALEQLAASGELRQWREVCDVWCAAFLGTRRMPAPLFTALCEHVLRHEGSLPAAVAEQTLAALRGVAAERRFLHWPLELPEVFCDEAGRERPDGGFDAVIGNPPWEMVRADAGRLHGGDRPVVGFTRRSGVYHAQSDGHANLYQVFLERAVQLARPGGRLALVLPHGLASDHGAAPLRHLLLHRCRTDHIVGFENRAGVFPIHRGVRFLLVTATKGGETADLWCRFGVQDPEILDGLTEDGREGRESVFPVRLTPGLLERLSGPGLAIPDVRTATDVRIAERMATAHPRVTAAEGWGARFGRELNASDDRRHFTQASGGLRVIEGKHVAPFSVRPDPAGASIPRAAAKRLLPHEPYLRDRLAFRDVTSATNRTTLIAAIVPAGCVTTHSLFCLRTPLDREDQLLLCGLFNSFVANYLVRMRVSSHVTLAILDTLPVPRLHPHAGLGHQLAGAARALSAGTGDPALEPRLQALAARAYGLDDGEFAHVLGTFPLVPPRVRADALAAFREASRR